MTYAAPAPPYVGPPAHSSGTDNKPVHRVVIHCTVGPCALGEARDTAAWFRNPQASGSAHYVVDPAEVVQVAYDSVVAWHAPPNPNSIGVELCDPMDGNGRRWSDEAHHAMLRRAAELVAGLCLAYDVPVRKISAAGLRSGVHGICGHDDVSDAWHQSTHWDPGPAFPWPVFMDLVRHHVRRMSRDAVPVAAVGRVKAGQWPAATVARTVYHGEYEGLGSAWAELNAWITAQGHTTGPEFWEIYVAGPESSSDPATWRTELNRQLTR